MIATERTRERAQRERSEPRRAYSFERGGTLWMPKAKRLECISGGPGGSWAGKGEAAGGYTPLNLPGFASLRSWVTAQRFNSLTYNSGMLASGTGPPPSVTLTGTANALYDPYIGIDTTGGARGTAKFKWSIDGGVSFVQTLQFTAATFALGGTGLTANFSPGTYATDNVYVGKIVQWNDICGQGNHYENALGASGLGLPKVSVAGLNGKPSLYFKKSESTFLRRANSTYCTELAGGDDTNLTAFTVVQLVSAASGTHVVWGIADPGATTSRVGVSTSSSQWACVVKGSTGSELDSFGGTPDLTPYILEYVRSGSGASTNVSVLLTNAAGTTTIINAAVQNAPSLTVNEAFLGAVRSEANVYGDILIGEDLKYVGALDADTRGAIRGYLKRQWGL
jgi:hypothetical protein